MFEEVRLAIRRLFRELLRFGPDLSREDYLLTNDDLGNLRATPITGILDFARAIEVELPAFPAVTLLDDFARADGALGSDWTTPALYDNGALTIVGYAASRETPDSSGAKVWDASSFGPDFDAVIELSGTITDYCEADIIFRSESLIASPRNDIGVYYFAGPDYWGIGGWQYVNGTYTNLDNIDLLAEPVNHALGVRVYGNTLELWFRDADEWTLHGTYTMTAPIVTDFNATIGIYDTVGGEIKIDSFSVANLPDKLTVSDGNDFVARISAGGLYVGPDLGVASTAFDLAAQHTFTAKQTFDPSNSDPAIVATGNVEVAGKVVATETTLALDVNGPSELTGKVTVNPTYTESDGVAKRSMFITTNVNLLTGTDNSTEATAMYNEASLAASSVYKPSYFQAFFNAVVNRHATLKPGSGYAGSFLGQSEGAGGFGILAAVRALLSFNTGTTVDEASGILVEGSNATGATVGDLAGVRVGDQTGATNNYAIKTGAGRVYFGDFVEMGEISAPGAPGADKARLFVRDNGAGKTQICVRFPSGAIQVLSTEP